MNEEETLERLHHKLAEEAKRQGLLDVSYQIMDSPVGTLLLAATDAGLVRVAFGIEDHDAVLAALAGSISPRMLEARGRTDSARRQLEEYFEGKRTHFDLAFDLRLAKGFQRRVLDHLEEIRYGRTESYSEVALAAGSPKAVRAVGTACASNPLPVVVPCHRVLRRDGSLGGYVGGLDAKRHLLALERATAGQ